MNPRPLRTGYGIRATRCAHHPVTDEAGRRRNCGCYSVSTQLSRPNRPPHSAWNIGVGSPPKRCPGRFDPSSFAASTRFVV